MPRIGVAFYRERNGRSPALDWLDSIPTRALDKCRMRIERLAEFGHELRRPEADYLGEGIYELRLKESSVNYRLLYFFHGRRLAVISHGFVKQRSSVPRGEIMAAIRRKRAFEIDAESRTYRG